MFAVVWARSTLDDLVRIRAEVDPSHWIIVRDAVREIEHRLRVSPEMEGESRTSGQRISFVAPVAFTFQPIPSEHVVVVTNIWWFAKR